jgi:hypothetical protein
MADSMQAAIVSLKDILTSQRAPRLDPLEISARAMQTVQEEGGFSEDDLIDAGFVMARPEVANMYLNCATEELHKSFLHCHMKEPKKID